MAHGRPSYLYITCGIDNEKYIFSIPTKYPHPISHPKPMLTGSPEVPGPCKHKLSTKAATNGDPEVEQKRKKLEAIKKSMKPAPTQKPRNLQHIPVEATDESDNDVNTPAPPQKSTTSTKKPIIMKWHPC